MVRSKRSMIIAAVKTGVARSDKIEVMKIAHVVSGIRKRLMPGARIFKMVVR